MLFQPTNIVPDEVNGSGCVDLTENLAISWQVNGDSAMTAYQITIFANDAVSTQLYTTGQVTLDSPFWGRNASGEIQRYTATILYSALAGAGIQNGNEYKFLITQYWGANSVTQLTASVFTARANPIVTIDNVTATITTKSYTFTGTYYQAQDDAINSIRWIIAETGYEDDPLLDTGNIYGTGILQVSYDGFFTGVNYGIRCIVTTQHDISADTGWITFDVDYSLESPVGTASACQLSFTNAIFIEWTKIPSAYGYSIMRQKTGENQLKKIADTDATVGQIRDYSAKSNETYKYYIYPIGQVNYITGPLITNEVAVKYWFWSLMEAELEADGSYFVHSAHYFKYGDGGVKEGDISNNNTPTLLKNFTPYPTRQAVSSNYKTGSVSGYIGSIDATKNYTDTVKEVDAVMALSNTTNTLFLSDPKGHFLMVQTNGEVTAKTDIKKLPMPQTVTVPWVEVADASNILLVSEPGHLFYPTDAIINTSVYIDTTTGALMWRTPDNYTLGSTLSLVDGELVQTVSGSFTDATMSIDSNMMLNALVPDET